MAELSWTEEQYGLVRDLIAEEVEKARLAHKFVPEFTLGEEARNVPAEVYDADTDTVDDVNTIPLVEVWAPVNLTRLQAEDADLSAALMLLRRAANRLARAHDAIVFTGQPAAGQPPDTAPPNVEVAGGRENDGISGAVNNVDVGPVPPGSFGEELVRRVAQALVQLENAGYIGSYVLVLGQQLFTDANTPSRGSLAMPRDRIEALLGGGPVHRSTVLEDDRGLLLSLGGEPMDRAVAVAPRFEFLRIGNNEVRECRVFERFALRLKEEESVITLTRRPAADGGHAEQVADEA